MDIYRKTGLPAAVFSSGIGGASRLPSLYGVYLAIAIHRMLFYDSFAMRALYRSTSSLWNILQCVAINRNTSDSL